MLELSIVTTMYCSESFLTEFYSRASASAKSITSNYEIIFVDDGSPDKSSEVIYQLHTSDEKVKLVELSRNFGHHQAMLTGLRYAQGKRVFLIDCDLEESPELLIDFWNKMRENSEYDVVYGVQEKRKGGFFESLSGALYYRVLNSMSDIPIPRNFLTVRLMSLRYVHELLKYDERVMQFSFLTELVGFKKTPMPVEKLHKGSSTYGFRKKLSHAIKAITSTSSKPLHWIFNTGLLTTTVSILYITNIIYNSLTNGASVEGWASLIVSLWLIGGLIMMSIGTLGIYLAQIFTEVKKRPLVTVKNKHGFQGDHI